MADLRRTPERALSSLLDELMAASLPPAVAEPDQWAVLAERLVAHPDAPARRVNADLERLAGRMIATGSPIERMAARRLLLGAARFRHAAGQPELALAAVQAAQKVVPEVDDDLLEGQTLLALATAHLACDDSRNACAALERLNVHAARRPHAGLKLAAMGTGVLVLERMGLGDDARALALKLLDYPVQSREGQLAHVLNAINGVRTSHLVEHNDAASLFVEVLCEWAVAPSAALPHDVWARAVVARATHLTAQGKPAQAQKALAEAIARCAGGSSLRALVILQCAHAAATVAVSDGEGIEWARESIAALLARTVDLPLERVELLHTSITLALASRAAGAQASAVDHLDALRDIAAASETSPTLLSRLPMSFEATVVPAAFSSLPSADEMWLYEGVDGMCVSFDRDNISLFTESDLSFDAYFAASSRPSEAELEAPLRTPTYEVAENWAVAVELSAGGSGRQCFRVGRIAAALSLALGFTAQRAVVVDLACRLRDIGRASIATLPQGAGQRRSWDTATLLREQATAGDRILSFAADPTIAVAMRVARQRHRWWNGCGPTRGALGEAIAVEARICAVADAFVSLVDPIGDGPRWSIENALGQVQAMAGVQLDPELVGLLTRAVRFDETPEPTPAVPWVESAVEASRLAEAHRRMKKSLELAL